MHYNMHRNILYFETNQTNLTKNATAKSGYLVNIPT